MAGFNNLPWVELSKDDLILVEESVTGSRGKTVAQRLFRIDFTDTPSWDDLRFPATAINPPGLVGDPDWDTSNGGWLFDATVTETLYVVAQLPHSWLEGSTLFPHVHWEKSAAGAGDVLWSLRYEWAPIGEVRSSLETLSASTAAVDSDLADSHNITPFGELDATGRGVSDMLMMRLERQGGNASDTYASDARLLEFDIHYQISRIGTEDQF